MLERSHTRSDTHSRSASLDSDGGQTARDAHDVAAAVAHLDRGQRRLDAQIRPAPVDLARGHTPPDAQVARASGEPSTPGRGHDLLDAQATDAPVGSSLERDHPCREAQTGDVAPSLPPAIAAPTSKVVAPGTLDRGHHGSDAHRGGAPVKSSNGNGQSMVDTQVDDAVADTFDGQSPADAHSWCAVETSEEGGHARGDTQTTCAAPSEALLLILADALDDLERQRTASKNRLDSLVRVKGLQGSRAEAKLTQLTEALIDLEHTATLELQRAMRDHPLGGWVKRTVGIGEKQGARLIAAIGDPYIREPSYDEDGNEIEPRRPRRGPAELWAYCGYAPAQKRQKGVKANWNADAKMRAYLCAEACMKQRTSPYRAVYDAARASWAERDTTDLHKHNHALRLVAKAILKDLWLEARAKPPAMPMDTAPAPPPEPQGSEVRS